MSVSITLPVVNETEGALAAQMINDALTTISTYIDTHSHVSTGGLIPPTGLTITSDLDFQNNASLLQKYSGFTNNLAAPSAGHALYVKDDGMLPPPGTGDLWYNNGLIDIQITDGASVLTTTDGFTDDYNNTPSAGTGMTGYNISTNSYRFSDGSGINSGSSSLSKMICADIECENVFPLSNNTYDLGGPGAEWKDVVGMQSLMRGGEVSPTGMVGDDPHNRNSQNSVVARGTFDASSGIPLLPTNHWNIDSAVNAGTDGYYTITLIEEIPLDSTISVTIDSAAFGPTFHFDNLLVATGNVASSTTIDIRLSWFDGVFKSIDTIFHMIVVG